MLSGFRTVKKSAAAKTAMSNCPKCGKPVYFAERKVILGKDWHASCLRCDKCDKVLTPGQHSAHKEKPYCNGCYQFLFGQEGFRKGVNTTKGTTIGAVIVNEQTAAEKQELRSKITEYNMYKESNKEKIKPTEINGQLFYEGVLKLYWGLKKPIRLAPGATYAKARNTRDSIYDFVSMDDAAYVMMLEEAQKVRARRDLDENERKKLQMIAHGWDSKETMPRDESQEDMFSMSLPSGHYDSGTSSLPGTLERRKDRHDHRSSTFDPAPEDGVDGNAVSRSLARGSSVDGNSRYSPRKRSASFRRISRQKKAEDKKASKHYNFTPPYGQFTNLRISNTVKTIDVLGMLLAKFKAENDVSEFALCVRYDSGREEVCDNNSNPLQLRLKLGPSEEIAKLFVVEISEMKENLPVSAEVAEWIKFSFHELELFCRKFEEEEEKESKKILAKFDRWKIAIKDTLRTLTLEQTDV